VSGVPFARKVTVPVGAAPELEVRTFVVTVKDVPASTLVEPVTTPVKLVVAGVIVYVMFAELPLKLLSPG
jgi:hypothetical protein